MRLTPLHPEPTKPECSPLEGFPRDEVGVAVAVAETCTVAVATWEVLSEAIELGPSLRHMGAPTSLDQPEDSNTKDHRPKTQDEAQTQRKRKRPMMEVPL